MKVRWVVAAAGAALVALGGNATAVTPDPERVERGRYVVTIAGCNDCHTADYAEKGGQVPEARWLTGDRLGWRGPWGTTYPANLRLLAASIDEAQWVALARTLRTRPPMPWFNVNAMTEDDLRSVFHYLRHLGPAGEPAPPYVPPDREPPPPFVSFPAPPG